jgi:fatty acid synthase
VTFMDNMLQMSILSVDSRLQYLPVAIKKITIDPVKHLKLVEGVSVKKPLVPVHVYKENKTIKLES